MLKENFWYGTLSDYYSSLMKIKMKFMKVDNHRQSDEGTIWNVEWFLLETQRYFYDD